MQLETTLERIGPLDHGAMAMARHHQALLAIPQGSLGRLHDLCIQLAGISGDPRPAIHHLAVVTMAGDHGVTRQGVSLFPQAVTREMVANFARGGAAINVLARHFNVRLTVVDMGVAGPPLDMRITPDQSRHDLPTRLLDHRIGDGTADISQGPAMTREQAVSALEAGIAVFQQEKAWGLHTIRHRRHGDRQHDPVRGHGRIFPATRSGPFDQPGNRYRRHPGQQRPNRGPSPSGEPTEPGRPPGRARKGGRI